MAIKVLIADDHQMVREGLKQLLEMSGKIQVVGQAGSGMECLQLVENLKPDVVLLDINMPNMDGITTLSYIKNRNYKCKTIMLTIHNEVDYLIKANELNCEGYILKDSDSVTLEKAIYTVYQGGKYIEPKMGALLNNTLINRERDFDKLNSLSNRETSILKLIAKGYANKDIADELNITERTVKNHISNIFKKIGTSDRTQAAVFAIKYNLIKIN